MAPAALYHWLCHRGAQPAVGHRLKHPDHVAVQLIVGVERTKAVRTASKHKHLCPDDGGGVEVPPACWGTLGTHNQQTSIKPKHQRNESTSPQIPPRFLFSSPNLGCEL